MKAAHLGADLVRKHDAMLIVRWSEAATEAHLSEVEGRGKTPYSVRWRSRCPGNIESGASLNYRVRVRLRAALAVAENQTTRDSVN
ncbi:MAG TPA: hypothetical protein VE549_13375, partial [Myxococcaceae bacterium]|nr:hypothetical protein [Myxococcaceae bacterium]